MVYFIGDLQNMVCKIGSSERPLKRLKAVQTCYPFELTILKTVKGSRREELDFHYLYSEAKLHGEWFDISKIDILKDDVMAANFHTETVFGFNVFVSKENGFYNASRFVSELNKVRYANGIGVFNLSQWMDTSDTITVSESIRSAGVNPYKKFGSIWMHPYMFFELIQNCGQSKVEALEFILSKSILGKKTAIEENVWHQ